MFLSASKCQIKNGGFSVQCDFSVKIGDHLSLFGPSGSGKSSVLLGLAGFLPIINGDLVTANHPHLKNCKIPYIFNLS